jgi:hypothetical protein
MGVYKVDRYNGGETIITGIRVSAFSASRVNISIYLLLLLSAVYHTHLLNELISPEYPKKRFTEFA